FHVHADLVAPPSPLHPVRPCRFSARVDQQLIRIREAGLGCNTGICGTHAERVHASVLRTSRARECDAACGGQHPSGEQSGAETSRHRTAPLRLKVAEPAEGAQSGHKAEFPAARDHKVWNSLNSSSYRLTGNRKIFTLAIRSRNWISVLAGAKKHSVIDPL